MKMFFVGNENFATALKASLDRHLPSNDVVAIDFNTKDFKAGTRELAAKLFDALTDNSQEDFLFLADACGSTAFNETSLLLAKSGLSERSLILTGADLPMAIKYYGLLDNSLDYLRSLQEEKLAS